MSSKNNAHPANSSIHPVNTVHHGQGHHGVLHYWPILLFVLISALTQIIGPLF